MLPPRQVLPISTEEISPPDDASSCRLDSLTVIVKVSSKAMQNAKMACQQQLMACRELVKQ